MTDRQRRFHQQLRECPYLHGDVEQALSALPVGTSVHIRLPRRFEAPSVTPALIATKTPRGIEYVEDRAFHRKGWTAPRPRLLPMRGA